MDYTQMDLQWQNMMAGIEAQVPFIRQSPHVVYEQVRDRLALKKPPSRVYLVGCGDSWYCGMATRLAFEAWSGVPTEAMQALEFSRYSCAYAPKDALVVGISNSGRVSRTVEAVMMARARGIRTASGTSAPDSPIAQEADVALDLGSRHEVIHAVEAADQRALAAAGRADQGGDFMLRDVEIDVVKNLVVAIGEGEVLHLDKRSAVVAGRFHGC